MLFCESEAEPAARPRAMTARMPEHTEAIDAKPLPSRLTQRAARRRSQPAGRAFELEDHGRQLRGGLDDLAAPLVQRTRRLEQNLESRASIAVAKRHVEAQGVRREQRCGFVAEDDGPGPQRRAQLLLQPIARRPRLAAERDPGAHGRHQRCCTAPSLDRAPAITVRAHRGRIPFEHPTSW